MEGYYILGGILFLFSLGMISLICDVLFKEEDIIFMFKRKKKQPESDLAQFVADDYDIDNNLFDQ